MPAVMVPLLLWSAAAVALAISIGELPVSAAVSGGSRGLLSLRETRGNVSFQCFPSGPCIRCQYSEKTDGKYMCSETGYRVPLKCVEFEEGLKKPNNNNLQRRLLSFLDAKVHASVQQRFASTQSYWKWRKLLEEPSLSDSGKQSYVTFRSCLPVDGEERLSVLGFEVIVACLLLVSGTVVYLRRKGTLVMPEVGAVRIPTNSPRLYLANSLTATA